MSLKEDQAKIAHSVTASNSLPQSEEANATKGNLFYNVLPPSTLPNFIASTPPTVQPAIENSNEKLDASVILPTHSSSALSTNYATPQFEAAIPVSKGLQYDLVHPLPIGEENQHDDSGGLLGWMKDAISTNSLLAKVAKTAKNSVDSMITTLDPQMKQFLCSGGEIKLFVTTENEAIVSAVREAFQDVFGKATIEGKEISNDSLAQQPVGIPAGLNAAEKKAKQFLETCNERIPIVSVQSFLLNIADDTWYELSVLLLTDPEIETHCKTFTQMTSIPQSIIEQLQEKTPNDYYLEHEGFAVSVCNLMTTNLLNTHADWHFETSGVSQRDIFYLTAKSLASNYQLVRCSIK